MNLSDIPTPKFKIGDVVIYCTSSTEAWQSKIKAARCVLINKIWAWYYRVEIAEGALFTEDLLKDVREVTK